MRGRASQHAEGPLRERDGLGDAAREPERLGVEVEGEGAGRAGAVRPARSGHRRLARARLAGAAGGPPHVTENPSANQPLASCASRSRASPPADWARSSPRSRRARSVRRLVRATANGSMNAGIVLDLGAVG